MITGLIVTALLACLTALVGLLPAVTIPTSTANVAGEMGGQINAFLPLSQIALAVLAVLAVKVAMSLWGVVLWVYHQFWGSD